MHVCNYYHVDIVILIELAPEINMHNPSRVSGSHAALFTFAVLILLALFGVLYGSTPFYVIYCVLHVAATLALSAQIYYMGRWKLDWGIFRRIWYVMFSRLCRGNCDYKLRILSRNCTNGSSYPCQ